MTDDHAKTSDSRELESQSILEGKPEVLDQKADLSAIMLFNTDRRFFITE